MFSSGGPIGQRRLGDGCDRLIRGTVMSLVGGPCWCRRPHGSRPCLSARPGPRPVWCFHCQSRVHPRPWPATASAGGGLRPDPAPGAGPLNRRSKASGARAFLEPVRHWPLWAAARIRRPSRGRRRAVLRPACVSGGGWQSQPAARGPLVAPVVNARWWLTGY